jgi:dephospho-CoA kinase
MRELVFERPEARQQLQAILHPLIRSECEREALAATGAYVIFVVPLLVEWRLARTGQPDSGCRLP